ncbi:MAG: hypothetical protein K2N44_11720, partial [Lachnospiraceae bacterium]|nr:hypothetical protein [Lachnospiraceae bacterium]
MVKFVIFDKILEKREKSMSFIQKILNVLNKNSLKGNITISIPESDSLLEYNRDEFYQRIIVLLNEILIVKANAKIDRVNELAIVINQTTDRNIFYASVDEIENILIELSEIEQKLNLSQPPSEHLKKFRNAKDKQIALLEKRISEEANAQSSDKNIADTQNESFDSHVSEDIQEGLSVFEAYKMLEKAKKLSEIANETTDRKEFYDSINEIKVILAELSEYEGKLPFISSPSTDLKNLEQIEQSQIKLLEKRISKVTIHSRFKVVFFRSPVRASFYGIMT